MANICWFEMRVRGTQENCYAMLNSGLQCEDAYVTAENGTDDDYMVYVSGNCRWDISSSMMNECKGETLAAKAQKYDVELEACGLSEDGGCERFHYKGSQVIKENNLASYYTIWDMEEVELSEEELAKYQKIEEQNIYALKEEFCENFVYDEERGQAIFNFEMSFKDLPGFEDYEEPVENDDENPFGDKSAILAMMGITPDENGFAISYYEDEGQASLFEYFGEEKKVVVPDGVTTLEVGCFSDNEIIEEVILPTSLEFISAGCFENCPNLKKIFIPSNVEEFDEEDEGTTFGGTTKTTIHTSAGSAAEEFANSRGIKVVIE